MPINWRIVGALAGWAGAIATFAAVIVSLKLARGDVPKLKVSAHIQRYIPGPQSKIGIQISNCGRRPVKLLELYFRVANTKYELSPLLELHRQPIEVMLGEGDSIQFGLEFDEVLGYLDTVFKFDELLRKRPNTIIRVGVVGVIASAESHIHTELRKELARLIELRSRNI